MRRKIFPWQLLVILSLEGSPASAGNTSPVIMKPQPPKELKRHRLDVIPKKFRRKNY